MVIVTRDLPELQKDTLREFHNANQQCVSITHKIPSNADYYLVSTTWKSPKAWKYSFPCISVTSRINREHTEALVNVGLFSYADSN